MDELKPCPGSSPRTRGAPCRARTSAWSPGDHPRVRGEHHKRPTTKDGVSRIIPAYAGSTVAKDGDGRAAAGSSPRTRGAPSTHPPPRACSWDHPRVRGEHYFTELAKISKSGIIPAYAGSTSPRSRSARRDTRSSPRTRGALGEARNPINCLRDHPRVRGEHGRARSASFLGYGIIPAYAGSTPSTATSTRGVPGSSPRTRGAPYGRSARCT